MMAHRRSEEEEAVVNASTSGASVTELLIPIRLADFTDFVNTTVLYLLLPDHISELDILFILYIR